VGWLSASPAMRLAGGPGAAHRLQACMTDPGIMPDNPQEFSDTAIGRLEVVE
jgi:hypothetical protein